MSCRAVWEPPSSQNKKGSHIICDEAAARGCCAVAAIPPAPILTPSRLPALASPFRLYPFFRRLLPILLPFMKNFDAHSILDRGLTFFVKLFMNCCGSHGFFSLFGLTTIQVTLTPNFLHTIRYATGVLQVAL
jgi:hypothetical protein